MISGDFDGQRIHGTGKVFMQWVVDELKPLIRYAFQNKTRAGIYRYRRQLHGRIDGLLYSCGP